MFVLDRRYVFRRLMSWQKIQKTNKIKKYENVQNYQKEFHILIFRNNNNYNNIFL